MPVVLALSGYPACLLMRCPASTSVNLPVELVITAPRACCLRAVCIIRNLIMQACRFVPQPRLGKPRLASWLWLPWPFMLLSKNQTRYFEALFALYGCIV